MMPGGLALKTQLVIAVTTACSLFSSGCGRDRRSPSSTHYGSDRNLNVASPSPGDCYNPFFPLIPDGTLEYETTLGNISSYSYSVTFTDVSEGSFVQHQEVIGGAAPALYGTSLDRTWRCQPDGL